MSTESLLCRKNSQECSCEWGVIEANPDTNGERVAIHVDGIWQRSIAILIGQVEVKVVVGIQIWKIKKNYLIFLYRSITTCSD